MRKLLDELDTAEERMKLLPEHEVLLSWIDTPKDGRVKLWRQIPVGEGWIGQSEGRRRVRVVRPFLMAAVPVTNAQYAAFHCLGSRRAPSD